MRTTSSTRASGIGSYIATFDDLLANLERLYPAELLGTF